VTADLFNLFVFMELVAVSSYALVAVGGGRTRRWPPSST
jgi:formate hydrogenlyase subunit 3/multisubunit Na+/H+ antiporter MnhD subunit